MGSRDAVFALSLPGFLPSFSMWQITANKSCPALTSSPQILCTELICPIKICYYVYYKKCHIPRTFVETINSNCLTLQLPKAVIQVRAKQRITKIFMKKMENKLSIKDFEKLQHVPDIEIHTNVQSYEHAQERSEKAIISSLSLALKLYASRMWKLRQSCKLTARALKAQPNTHPQPFGRGCETYSFKIFKEISVSSLAGHSAIWVQISAAALTENIDFPELIQKSH